MLFQHLFPSAMTEKFHTEAEGFSPFPISVLYQLLQNLLLHQFDLALIRHPESRIQSDFVKMVPQQEKAKTVDGSDLGIVQQSGLFLDMLRLRLFIQLCGYS